MEGLRSLLHDVVDRLEPYDIIDRTEAAVRRRRRRDRLAPAAVFLVVAAIAVAVLIAASGVGRRAAPADRPTWPERADAIEGIVNYHRTEPGRLTGYDHLDGPIEYAMAPPVAGPHNPRWQNCMGDVYAAPIANEHAVHSLEHGAVWITYRPGLPADQVRLLVATVRGESHLMMSPYPGQESPISLQAWGYQLAVDRADDPRVDEFIDALRHNAAPEPNATCADGVTSTGRPAMDAAGGQTGG
jgi:hypothetical protein